MNHHQLPYYYRITHPTYYPRVDLRGAIPTCWRKQGSFMYTNARETAIYALAVEHRRLGCWLIFIDVYIECSLMFVDVYIDVYGCLLLLALDCKKIPLLMMSLSTASLVLNKPIHRSSCTSLITEKSLLGGYPIDFFLVKRATTSSFEGWSLSRGQVHRWFKILRCDP